MKDDKKGVKVDRDDESKFDPEVVEKVVEEKPVVHPGKCPTCGRDR